ncbi:MAG: hypothetical protein U1F11_04175 [Steroidobacteraceae bacterium]
MQTLRLTLLLIVHGLVGVALLGATTHQAVALLRGGGRARDGSFTARYAAAGRQGFAAAIVALFAATVALGAVIYPDYRLDVRVPFEEMGLGWAIGSFELKEHFAGIALGILPLYAVLWRPQFADSHRRDRSALSLLLAAVAWWDFVVGHVLNNIRGFG